MNDFKEYKAAFDRKNSVMHGIGDRLRDAKQRSDDLTKVWKSILEIADLPIEAFSSEAKAWVRLNLYHEYANGNKSNWYNRVKSFLDLCKRNNWISLKYVADKDLTAVGPRSLEGGSRLKSNTKKDRPIHQKILDAGKKKHRH